MTIKFTLILLAALAVPVLSLPNPFVLGLELGSGTKEVEAAMVENGWTVAWYGLLLRNERPGAVVEYYWNEDEEEPVVILYAEAHPPDETRTEAYGAWLDVLREIFGEPEDADGFHRWDTGDYEVDIAAEPFFLRGDFPEPAVVITITRSSKAGLSRYGWSFTEKGRPSAAARWGR